MILKEINQELQRLTQSRDQKSPAGSKTFVDLISQKSYADTSKIANLLFDLSAKQNELGKAKTSHKPIDEKKEEKLDGEENELSKFSM